MILLVLPSQAYFMGYEVSNREAWEVELWTDAQGPTWIQSALEMSCTGYYE